MNSRELENEGNKGEDPVNAMDIVIKDIHPKTASSVLLMISPFFRIFPTIS